MEAAVEQEIQSY